MCFAPICINDTLVLIPRTLEQQLEVTGPLEALSVAPGCADRSALAQPSRGQ
jgi:hypothetical protein